MATMNLKPEGAAGPVAVEIQRSGERIKARVGEAVIEAVVETLPDGAALLRMGHRTHRCYFVRSRNFVDVWVDGQASRFEVVETRSARATSAAGLATQEITAPMPGTVLRINVAPGDRFEDHQPLIIMESMKMELTLSAPHGGRVTDILCRVGELVPMGKVLAKLEAVDHAAVSA